MRWVLRAAVLVVVCVIGVLALVLVPPHLQIRRVTPRIPELSELEALAVADGPVAVSVLTISTQQTPQGRLGHHVFLLEWADGRLFMIDAGMGEREAEAFGEIVEFVFRADPQVFEADVAALLGPRRLQRVEGVGFTHLHIDHAQGVVPFCAKRGRGAVLYQTPWQAVLRDRNTEESAELIERSCLERRIVGGSEGVQTIDAFPGLGIVAAGGHTPGSTIFAAWVDQRLWLFAGDITNSKVDLIQNVGKGFVYSYVVALENTARLEELRLWLAGLDAMEAITVIVSHDFADIRQSGLPPAAAPGSGARARTPLSSAGLR